ncbi:uncharacterized, partial [Tachysurus ichikawai]
MCFVLLTSTLAPPPPQIRPRPHHISDHATTTVQSTPHHISDHATTT